MLIYILLFLYKLLWNKTINHLSKILLILQGMDGSLLLLHGLGITLQEVTAQRSNLLPAIALYFPCPQLSHLDLYPTCSQRDHFLWLPQCVISSCVLNFENIGLNKLKCLLASHTQDSGGNCLTQTVGGMPYDGLIESSSSDQEWNAPTAISYNRKSPTCFHWVGSWKHKSFTILAAKSGGFGAEAKIPRKNVIEEFSFRNISCMRKATDYLEYKLLQPNKKKLFRHIF